MQMTGADRWISVVFSIADSHANTSYLT